MKKFSLFIVIIITIFLIPSVGRAAIHTDCWDYCPVGDTMCHIGIENEHWLIEGCTNKDQPTMNQGCILSIGTYNKPIALSAMVCGAEGCEVAGKLKCPRPNGQLPKFPSIPEGMLCPPGEIVTMRDSGTSLGTTINCGSVPGTNWSIVCDEDANAIVLTYY